jgi:uncharacterized membrane protein YqjE
MPEQTPRGSKGLLDSLTAFAASLVAIIHTRLDLMSTDLEEEREHWQSLLVLTLTALFCLGVGVILVTILFVVIFWDTHRLLVLGAFAGLFLAGGALAWRFAVNKAKTKPKLFAASLSELLKDRQQLTSRP